MNDTIETRNSVCTQKLVYNVGAHLPPTPPQREHIPHDIL